MTKPKGEKSKKRAPRSRQPGENTDNQWLFIQVHRSVAEKAAKLAPVLKLPYQFVRGSMDVLWEGIVDRRLLEATVRAAVVAGAKPVLVFGPEEMAARLELAFGGPVDPLKLVTAGFLELHPGGFRVRGASRYLAAELSRLKKTKGWAKLAAGTGVPTGSNQGGTRVQPPVAPPVAPGTDPGSLPPDVRRETLDVRRETEPPPPAAPETRVVVEGFEALWLAFQEARAERQLPRELHPPAGWTSYLAATQRALIDDAGRLWSYRKYLADPTIHAHGHPTAVFIGKEVWSQRLPPKKAGQLSLPEWHPELVQLLDEMDKAGWSYQSECIYDGVTDARGEPGKRQFLLKDQYFAGWVDKRLQDTPYQARFAAAGVL